MTVADSAENVENADLECLRWLDGHGLSNLKDSLLLKYYHHDLNCVLHSLKSDESFTKTAYIIIKKLLLASAVK